MFNIVEKPIFTTAESWDPASEMAEAILGEYEVAATYAYRVRSPKMSTQRASFDRAAFNAQGGASRDDGPTVSGHVSKGDDFPGRLSTLAGRAPGRPRGGERSGGGG